MLDDQDEASRMRKFKYIAGIALASVLLVLAYSNCGKPSSGGSESLVAANSSGASPSSPRRGGGNGDGYEGLIFNAPLAVKSGSQFVASVSGGTAPYVFEVLEGPAKIIKTEASQVLIEVESGTEGKDIRVQVQDAAGNIGSGIIAIVRLDSNFSNFDKTQALLQKVVLSEGKAFVGWPTLATYQQARVRGSTLTLLKRDLNAFSCGYISTHRFNSATNGWEPGSVIKGCELQDRLFGKVEPSKGIVVMDFGGRFAVRGNTLAVLVRYSWDVSRNLTVKDLVAFYERNLSTDEWEFKQVVLPNQILNLKNANTFSELQLVSEQEALLAFYGLSVSSSTTSKVISLQKQNGLWRQSQVIELSGAKVIPRKVLASPKRFFVFQNSNVGLVTEFEKLPDQTWRSIGDIHQPHPGFVANVAFKDNKLFWNIVLDQEYPEGSLAAHIAKNGLMQSAGVTKHRLEVQHKVGGQWATESSHDFESSDYCREFVAAQATQIAFLCKNVPPALSGKLTNAELNNHLFGSVEVLQLDSQGGWKNAMTIRPPTMQDTFDYNGLPLSYSARFADLLEYDDNQIAVGLNGVAIQVYTLRRSSKP